MVELILLTVFTLILTITVAIGEFLQKKKEKKMLNKKRAHKDLELARMCQLVAAHKFYLLTKNNELPPFMCKQELRIAEAWTNAMRHKGLIPELYNRIVRYEI